MSFTVVKDSYPNIVKDGLVLNVDAGSRLSYSGSGTTWSDISGSGNNGTLTNGPTYSSANSGSIVFDGTNDYVSGSIPTLNNWSMCLWYRSTDITSQVVFYPFSGTTGANGLGFGGTFDVNTNNRWYFFDGTNNFSSSNTAITTNVWYYLVVTKSSTTYNLYTNGSLSLSSTGVDLSLTQYNLGRRGDNLWYVNGQIAQASIYNRALSAAEVLQNYNALLPRFYSIVTSGLVLNLDAGNPNSYSPPRSDQYASSLVLAVPMNGANNGTTFTDQSAIIKGSGTAKTITVNGDTKTLVAQSKFYGSSGFFDGATATLLLISSSADFAFGTGAYTIEAWIYPTAYASAQGSIFDAGNANGSFDFFLTSTGALGIGIYGTGNTFVTSASAVSLNQWTHVSITRTSTSASSARFYVNGALASTGTDSSNWTVNTTPSVGGINIAGYSFSGYIQDLRVYKGVAKYTTNFKPPSISSGVTISSASGGVPILNTTDDYGTVNGSSGTTWTDISGNGNNGTLTNGPTYNGANYGSIVFDGTNDYTQLTSQSLSSVDFSVEVWFYATKAVSSNQILYTSYNLPGGAQANTFIFNIGGSKVVASTGGAPNASSVTTISTNTWYHAVVTYTASNTTLRLYLNGNFEASVVAAVSSGASSNYIGGSPGDNNTGTWWFGGSIPVVRAYRNKVLSAAEVLQNYNATKWRYGI